MNILLIIIGIIAGLILLVLLIALFSKKSYALERSILISRPRQEVFNYIKHLKNQDYFNKWTMTDPNMKKTFTGTDGTVGFIYAWNGNKQAGEGAQEIMRIVEGERVDIDIRFIRPFAGLSKTPFTVETVGDQTRVTWGVSSTMKYPMNAMLLFVSIEKLLGKDLETSLKMLNKNLEG